MNKRERVLAAIQGQEVDRVPFSLWLHDFTRENTAEDLADETIRLYHTYGFDFLKPQSRPYCFNQLWGQVFEPSTDPGAFPVITHYPLQRAEDIGKLETVDASVGALDEQLDAYLRVRKALGPDVPIVATVFAPLMVAGFMADNGISEMRRLMTDAPEALERGLQTIAEALVQHTRRCIDAGLDGIFYATTAATCSQMNAAQFERFQRPFDLQILQAADAASFNIMHMCGDGILAESFVDYPVQVFSWATSANNPSLSDWHNKTGRAVLGGLPGKPAFGNMTPEQIQAHGRKSLQEMKGRWHLLGPDCSVNPGVSPNLLAAASELGRSAFVDQTA